MNTIYRLDAKLKAFFDAITTLSIYKFSYKQKPIIEAIKII